MAASYNAKKIIFKNFNFEIMDVKKCPVRNVSDGTINDVYSILCIDQWHVHHTCPWYRLGLASMYMKRFSHEKNMCSFYLSIYMFCNFFPIILPWDWNIWIKNNTNYSTIYLEVQSPCKIVGWCFPHHTITWQSWEVNVRTITACRGINELYVWLYEENSSVQTVDITI